MAAALAAVPLAIVHNYRERESCIIFRRRRRPDRTYHDQNAPKPISHGWRQH